jgi:hypothetical protein
MRSTGRANATAPGNVERLGASDGSAASSPRTTTAERASITPKTAGTALRPTGLRSAAVMSMNARSPAIPNPAGPSIGSTGLPVASSASDAPITRNAERPIGVIGRVRPWASEALRWTRRPGLRGGGTG